MRTRVVWECAAGRLRLPLPVSGGCWLGAACPRALLLVCVPSLNSLPAPFPSSAAVVDPDGRIYIRNWQGGILSGGFEKNPKPLFTEGRNQLEIQNLQEDWDHFGMLGRLPQQWNALAEGRLPTRQAVVDHLAGVCLHLNSVRETNLLSNSSISICQ